MLDRTISPSYYPPQIKDIVLPRQFDLDTGVKSHTFHDDSQKVFKIELNFPVGSSVLANPAIASICIAMLREGTTTRSAVEINNTLDYYGAYLDLKSGLESITISIYGHSAFFPKLIPLLADIVQNPTFNEDSIAKHIQRASQKLTIDQEKTSYWSPRLLRQNIFGEQHPYSKLLSTDNFNEITQEDLINFHTQYILSGLQHIIIAGSIPVKEAEKAVQKHFTKIRFSNKVSNKVSSAFPEAEKLVTKKLEQANQGSISLGIKALNITDDNYPLYSFLTKVLGGYFGSRLMKNLREEKGLTYGIHAYNIHLKEGSYLQIAADVELKSVDKSVELVFAEIDKLNTEAIPQDELNTVKSFMLGEFINDSSTIFNFADLYKKLLVYQLPDNYYNSYYNKISAIQPEKLHNNLSNIWKKEYFSIIKVF